MRLLEGTVETPLISKQICGSEASEKDYSQPIHTGSTPP